MKSKNILTLIKTYIFYVIEYSIQILNLDQICQIKLAI